MPQESNTGSKGIVETSTPPNDEPLTESSTVNTQVDGASAVTPQDKTTSTS